MAAPSIEKHDCFAGYPTSPTEEESDEDWIFLSVKMYTHLYMFDLQQPSRCIEWSKEGGDSVFVAGCDNGIKNEVLELDVPGKLNSEIAKEALQNDRDFHIRSGGFSKTPVQQLRHLMNPGKLITCNKGEIGLHVWSFEDDSNVIKLDSVIKNPSCNTAAPTHLTVCNSRGLAACGSTLSNICIADLNTMQMDDIVCPHKTGCGTDTTISGLEFINDYTLVTSSTQTGELTILDTRIKNTIPAVLKIPEKSSGMWTFAYNKNNTSVNEANCLGDVYRVCSNGHVQVSDLRKPDVNTSEYSLAMENCCSDCKHFCVQLAPDKERRMLSVSGLDDCVHIYNLTSQSSSNSASAAPVFSHKGHIKCSSQSNRPLTVYSHTWHPSKKDTLLSTASDASLHAWQFTDHGKLE